MTQLLKYPWLKLDALNGFMVFAVGLFFILTLIYSSRFMKGKKNLPQYYGYVILTAIAAVGALLANNFILLLVFWGFLGLVLYLLINMGDEDADKASKKALIIVGGSDALMILGIAIINYYTHTFQMDYVRLGLNNWLTVTAYLCIAIACFAKAGAMPMHSWIPDCAKSAPIPVTAYLPASLDKLLGIYLLTRISLDLFQMNRLMNNFLMFIGAATIIAGVMMALVQHNMKKLLGFHAVSQVGYMVLGIGTANPIGIAGGLFHMLNHAVYKSCLFLTAGNVEHRTGTSELDELGGLGKFMPITYISCIIASFSISGVPPFNGFVSKWMIYQGLIENLSGSESRLQVVFTSFCLIAALFGSGLTLASFMKLLHAVFLGERINTAKEKAEVPAAMWFPPVVLASICVIFGIFAFVLPLKYFIFPAVPGLEGSQFPGVWLPVQATLLVICGLVIGLIVFKLLRLKIQARTDSTFTGGEAESTPESMVTGVDFYKSIEEVGLLKRIYKRAEGGAFDIYNWGKKIFIIARPLQFLHNGVLPTYMVWILLGMVCLFLTLAR